jgi:D-beta-D-heptose 7-phosphate kinase/D-beta-D-heptose 1-phosphate adenosyltransferase
VFTDPGAVARAIRTGFGARRVLVVGDLMLDRYLWGRVDRISPEAPVPVVRLQRETRTAGGAANVARNLTALGAKVVLSGVTGDDAGARRLLQDLAAEGVETGPVIASADRITTVKTRVIGDHQQMIRIDEEEALPLSRGQAEALIAAVLPDLASADALVLSDYAKGTLTERVCQTLIRAARAARVPVLVDPKATDFARYAGATLITPNRAELARATGVPARDLSALLAAAESLREALGLRWVVLTLGEGGIALVGPGGSHRIPALARDVFDVSGAGDTVIAALAAGMSAALDLRDAAHLANLAAGIVVGKVGTATVATGELLAAVSEEDAHEQAAKICTAEQALERVEQWRNAGERIVFTNGCFDLLHAGHVIYLERARRHGHRLVVGLNTDRSVRALKGPGRPVIDERDRALVLAALSSVDVVVLFDQDTPLELIRKLRPDTLAKGADYSEAEVVGADAVRSWGGQVILVPLVEDSSTTGIIRRLTTADGRARRGD